MYAAIGVKMEAVDFWIVHGWGFILCMLFFPRLTMLFGTAVTASFGVLGWVGWVLAPRLTVAIIATTMYWDMNPVLVVFYMAMGTWWGKHRKESSSQPSS